MSTPICCDDPVFALYQKHPDMGPVDFLVLWIIDQKAQVNARMSFAEIAKEAHVSVRTVGQVVRRHVGKCVTMVRNVGQSCIIRVSVSPRKKVPDSTSEPRKNLPDPEPGTLPPLSEEDLKALRFKLRVKEEKVVKAPPTARIKFSKEQGNQISEVVKLFAEVNGLEQLKQIDPHKLEVNLCFRILELARLRGAEAALPLLLAHHEETKQANKIKYRTLENAFMPKKTDGVFIYAQINEAWAGERIERGLAIMAETERRKAEISRCEQRAPREKPSPERVQHARATWRQAMGL